MKNIYSLVLIVVGLWLTGCRSASKLYEKGNYDDAVQVAAKKLQKDPNDPKLRSVIQDAYKYAVTDHENKIQNYSQNDNELKWEWMYYEYSALQNLYNAIFKTPSAFELVHPADYSSELNEYAGKAADVHYNHGLQYIRNNDRQSFKTAYHEFQTALGFDPGNVTIQNASNDAYNSALTRVVIVPALDYGFSYSSYNYQLQNYENDIVQILQNNSGNEFVKFYSSPEAERLGVIPDEVVETHFTQINIGRIKDNYSNRDISKDVVVKETVYKPDSVVKQYAKVKARVTTTQRTLYSEGNLNVVVRDATGRVLWTDNVIGSETWSTEFASYTGDERALGDDDKKILNRKRDNPPRDEEIISCMKDSIYKDFISRIRNYYSHY
ncbi:MAG TPA: hypothetical protein VGI82_00120 [Chitinophagaceae bacterium]